MNLTSVIPNAVRNTCTHSHSASLRGLRACSAVSLSRIGNGLIAVEMPRKKMLGMTRMSKFQLSRMAAPVIVYLE